MYSPEDVLNFVEEEDVRFIRLTFFDIYGIQKNISILPDQLSRAFSQGIAIDAFAVDGFGNAKHGDLYLHPDAGTFAVLPWRSTDGSVIYMVCDVTYPDGTPFENDTRRLLKEAMARARTMGVSLRMSTEFEFYLFHEDENGEQTCRPLDHGTYMDVAPRDRGENVRRQICMTLEEMGLQPQASYHQAGPGQNEIDFHASYALRAADEASVFKWVVRTVASGFGLQADFSPKPVENEAGNGLHINIQLESLNLFEPLEEGLFEQFMAGVLHYIGDMTLFANPTTRSYRRLGKKKAPAAISWSSINRCQLIRLPSDHIHRMEVRSPDCECNPYLVFSLLIHAGLNGIEQGMELCAPADMPLEEFIQTDYEELPDSLREASRRAAASDFIRTWVPSAILEAYKE